MKTYGALLFSTLFTLAVLTGCSEAAKPSDNAVIAKTYLMDKGFEVLSHERDGRQVFTESDVTKLPDRQVWAVQCMDPVPYLHKRIDTVTFTIKNHPLDELFHSGKTTATVWLYDGEVIGGWTYPFSKDNDLIGAPYSLDGKTAEEVQKMNCKP